MPSYNDYASLMNFGSTPMFSQGHGMVPPNQPMFSNPTPNEASWVPQYVPPTPTTGMGPGFTPTGGVPVDLGPNWWDGMTGRDGWGNLALGAASGLGQAFMGMKQYGLAKQTLEQNRQQFETQFNAQKGLTNASLRDRQAARVASNPGAYQSVGDYMAANGVK